MEIKGCRYTAGPVFLSIARRSIETSRGQSGNVARIKNKLVTENFERVTRDFGDFKAYNVLQAKATTISPQDQLAVNTIGSGIHTDVVCKARFSRKRDVHVWLRLIQETEGSQYIVAASNFEATP